MSIVIKVAQLLISVDTILVIIESSQFVSTGAAREEHRTLRVLAEPRGQNVATLGKTGVGRVERDLRNRLAHGDRVDGERLIVPVRARQDCITIDINAVA